MQAGRDGAAQNWRARRAICTMERMRIYVTGDTPEAALQQINALQGVEAGNGVIVGAGEPRPEEQSILIFYEVEGGKGELRIPFSSIAFSDEGVQRARMKRTLG